MTDFFYLIPDRIGLGRDGPRRVHVDAQKRPV